MDLSAPHGEYNIGCGVVYAHVKASPGLSRRLNAFLHEFPAAREIVQRATSVEPLRGAVLRTGLTCVRRMREPNVPAIGESTDAAAQRRGHRQSDGDGRARGRG